MKRDFCKETEGTGSSEILQFSEEEECQELFSAEARCMHSRQDCYTEEAEFSAS